MGNMWLIVPITKLVCQCYILALQTVYLSLIDFICIQIACQFGLWWGLMLGARDMRINVMSPRLPVMQLRTLFDKQSHIVADSNHSLIPVWMSNFTSHLIGYVITYISREFCSIDAGTVFFCEMSYLHQSDNWTLVMWQVGSPFPDPGKNILHIKFVNVN